ncbi:MAG: hypothetical protein IJO40_10755 [Thermoguttaceae bacterium]|nr:hypothetical protein [Thermoguttaceae bacterium]
MQRFCQFEKQFAETSRRFRDDVGADFDVWTKNADGDDPVKEKETGNDGNDERCGRDGRDDCAR